MFNIFKNQKKAEEEQSEKQPVRPAKRSGNYSLIKKPLVTEKSGLAARSDKYAFLVETRANKKEIRENAENIYGVRVRKVNIINKPGKEKRAGKMVSRPADLKKAILTLEKGYKIDYLK